MDIQLRLSVSLLSVTEALWIAKVDSKSSVLTLLDLSAAFDTVNHQILLSTLSSLDITGIPLRWFESYLTGRSFKVAWGGEVSTEHQLVTGVPQGSFLDHIHYITGSHHTSRWFLTIAMLMTHGSISHLTRWSDGSCTDLRLLDRHLGMDERTSPTAQPGKDWASCPPCHTKSTTWFHHPARFFYNYPINLSQKSWCNFLWPADFQRTHCKNCSILQVCIAQHQKDQVLPYTACSTTSCPGPCNF